jgi:hypothetical protein
MVQTTAMAEAWTLLDIAKAAEITISEIQERTNPTDAEIGEDATADWYLVRTFPGDDVRALRWLSRRRFGVFSPKQQRRAGRNDPRLVQGFEPVFPGWLFVYCWDIEKMKHRICASPGVMNIFCYPDTARPVPIDEDFIGQLRALGWVYREHAPHATHYNVRSDRSIRRIKSIPKHQRKALHKLKKTLRQQANWDSSTWADANKLEPHERIALLKRAVSAPSLRADTPC